MMYYVIYPDMLFLSNFIMDYIVVGCMEEFLHRKCGALRKIMTSAIGAIYSVLAVMNPWWNSLLKYMFTYIFMAFFMVLIAFGRCCFKELVRRFVLLYLVSFVLAGILNGMSMVVGNARLMKIILTYTILRICMYCLDFFNEKKSLYVQVVLNYSDVTVKLNGFVDTGNNLKDVISGKNVSIVEKEKIKGILAKDSIKEHIRMIPFHSVGEQNGMIEGYEIDSMVVDGRIINKPVIALYEGELSSDGDYGILVNKQLV